MSEPGKLYIVATSIGNRSDMTLRAIEVLKSVDLIAAEDTRHSKKLLQFYAIKTPMLSLHEHNEQQRIAQLAKRFQQGQNIALISDAGTPLISDPGYRLVYELTKENIQIIPIPGACALISALSVSGLPTDRFVFEGFLPAKGNARLERIKLLQKETRTIILYEASHRIVNLIKLLYEVFGENREVVIARELTKIFETVKRANLGEIKEWLNSDVNQQKGEFVVLIKGADEQSLQDEQEYQRLLTILLDEMPLKKAVSVVAKITNGPRNLIYDLALKMKDPG